VDEWACSGCWRAVAAARGVCGSGGRGGEGRAAHLRVLPVRLRRLRRGGQRALAIVEDQQPLRVVVIQEVDDVPPARNAAVSAPGAARASRAEPPLPLRPAEQRAAAARRNRETLQTYIEVSSIFIFEMASALQRSALAILPSIHSILASPARAFSSSSDMAAGGR